MFFTTDFFVHLEVGSRTQFLSLPRYPDIIKTNWRKKATSVEMGCSCVRSLHHIGAIFALIHSHTSIHYISKSHWNRQRRTIQRLTRQGMDTIRTHRISNSMISHRFVFWRYQYKRCPFSVENFTPLSHFQSHPSHPHTPKLTNGHPTTHKQMSVHDHDQTHTPWHTQPKTVPKTGTLSYTHIQKQPDRHTHTHIFSK